MLPGIQCLSYVCERFFLLKRAFEEFNNGRLEKTCCHHAVDKEIQLYNHEFGLKSTVQPVITNLEDADDDVDGNDEEKKN